MLLRYILLSFATQIRSLYLIFKNAFSKRETIKYPEKKYFYLHGTGEELFSLVITTDRSGV